MKAKGGLKVLDQAVEMVQVLAMFSALDELLCNSINLMQKDHCTMLSLQLLLCFCT